MNTLLSKVGAFILFAPEFVSISRQNYDNKILYLFEKGSLMSGQLTAYKKGMRHWSIYLLVVIGLFWAQANQAATFQGELSDPGEEAVIPFNVDEVIPGKPAKVRIRTYGMNGGEAYYARSSPTGSPLPKKTTIPSGGFHSRLSVYDSSDSLIAQESNVLRTSIGTIHLETTMHLELTPGEYTLKITPYLNYTFNDTQGNVNDGKWAVQILAFSDLVDYVIPEIISGGTGLQVDAVFAVADAIPELLNDLTDKKAVLGAANFGGFDHFNWFQLITSIDDPFSCRGTGVDPSILGNCADNLSQAQLHAMKALFPEAYSEAITNFTADIHPWYWDEYLISNRNDLYVTNNTTHKELKYEDNPSGFSIGTTIEFETYLVGVLSDKEGYAFAEPTFKKTAFKWRYNQNIIQDAVVDGVQFFQADDRSFFVPETGGSIEFLGVLEVGDWIDALPALRDNGISLVGLPADLFDPPSTPIITGISTGNSELYVFVTVNDDGGAPISKFTVDCSDGNSAYAGISTSSPITVSGLTNGVAYTCSATVTNGYKNSDTSKDFGPARPNKYLVSAGGYHNCALDDAGVVCWGRNDYDQTVVPALTNPVQVTAGGFHSCALDDTGVTCWGNNGYAQTSVPALTNPVKVSAGIFHSCALDDTGVVCWGRNNFDQTVVPALTNPVQINAGGFHSCALDDSGAVCWGRNDLDQTTIPGLTNSSQINAGYFHSCALDAIGAHCWGNNGNNQSNVPDLNNPVQVDAGLYHSCALDDVGVHCWGSNSSGQSNVPALNNPAHVSAGNFHSCALDDAGIQCWGGNDYGQTDGITLSFNDLDSDGDDTVNRIDTDDDGDGLSDDQEAVLGTNPLKPDTDDDGLSDKQETLLGTNPLKLDTDGDGTPDGEEVERDTDPLDPAQGGFLIFKSGLETK